MQEQKLRELIGPLPKESGFKKRMRFHQAWWRAFVLAEPPGEHPIRRDKSIGSAIRHGEDTGGNFLSENIRRAVNETLRERQELGAGIIEEKRLFNNLLSSQPLCFNFFGELKMDTELALHVLRRFYPDLTRVERVIFEFAPEANHTNDNSAFDVAFEVGRGQETGLIGWECKFTDTFSQKAYDKAAYREIYRQSDMFASLYEGLMASRYNQLFRNQLMAAALMHSESYDFVLTGLFCHQDDASAIETGAEFQKMLKGDAHFSVITYQRYIEEVQQLPLDWATRELVMMLWARYGTARFSDRVAF